MNLNELLQGYFTAFSNKDINTLNTLLADDIVLIESFLGFNKYFINLDII